MAKLRSQAAAEFKCVYIENSKFFILKEHGFSRFQYALPALAGQLSPDNLLKVDAVLSKARRWQLTSPTPNSADLIEQFDSELPLIPPTICIAYCP